MVILLVLGVAIRVSFAWWTNTATQQSINKITSDCLELTITDVDKSAINLEKAYPVTDAEASFLKPYTFTITNVCNNSAEYSVQLEIMDLGETQIASRYLSMDFNNEGKKRVAEYQTVEPTYNLIGSKNYNSKDYTANEARYLTSGILTSKESVTYNLRIWIDESVIKEDGIENKEFIGKISATSSMIQFANINLAEMLIKKSETDSTIEEISHEATAQTPTLTDYRYTGENPDNYVYFDCEGSDCTEDNLYRIIGVIPTQSTANGEYENRVKLIKNNYYTEEESGQKLTISSGLRGFGNEGYYWGYVSSNHYNNWEISPINTKVLNNVYWNHLKEYQELIEPAKWYLGAVYLNNYSTYSTPNQIYTTERGLQQGSSKGPISYLGNIGLMYPSDYGYSLGSVFKDESFSTNAQKYVSSAWLYNLEKIYNEWTITPECVTTSAGTFFVEYSGMITFTGQANSVFVPLGIRPTFYLKKDVIYVSGSGSIENPYRISL